MNILVIGSGGREHAISSKIAESPRCGQLFIAPGNAGTAQVGTNISLAVNDFAAVEAFVKENQIEIVVVGPEQPLADGIADYLNEKNIPVVGPVKAGAILESSKDFSKKFMARHNVPTAAYQSFESGQEAAAIAFARQQKLPVVVKASGLAAGKGVLICEDYDSAEAGIREMLSGEAFGDAGSTIVIEEFLSGIEISVFILTDGKDYKLLPPAKDYKRIGEGDTGLNTGGMGAVTPVPFADEVFMNKVKTRIIEPTIQGLQTDHIDYKGFLFIGLMNVGGDPFVIEYNVRMGDPETEVVFPMIDSDVVDAFEALVQGRLAEVEFKVKEGSCATVFLVSGGYPQAYEKGKVISGINQVSGTTVFHAGTQKKGDDVVTSGGRVIALTSFGNDISEAVSKSLKAAEIVDFEGKYYRTDIGRDLVSMMNDQ